MGKKKPRPKSQAVPGGTKVDNSQVINALNAAIAPAPLLKVCRLCEAKDGPFLNIFGVEQPIAQKIAELMPFNVSEYDDLPHKICFRCSAKVEELHDFVEKCVKTQENLRQALGKKSTLPTKSKTRKIWEEKLNQSNMSNDEICDAVIKQAMKGIVDMPPSPPPAVETKKKTAINVDKSASSSRSHSPAVKKPTEDEKPLRGKPSEDPPKSIRPKRSSIPEKVTEKSPEPEPESELEEVIPKKRERRAPPKPEAPKVIKVTNIDKLKDPKNRVVPLSDDSNDSVETVLPEVKEKPAPQLEKKSDKPFRIEDYISTIKVNGVGTLHQCQLCNRNFLNQEVIMSHGCAKNGVPKPDVSITSSRPVVEPNKNPMASVKYINNRSVDKTEKPEKPVEPVEPRKPKPKIGPASRVKKIETAHNPELVGMRVAPVPAPPSPPPPAPPASATPSKDTPHFLPTIDIPGMNSRYRLVPGPNNTFTLIEDSPRDTNQPKPAPEQKKPNPEPEPESNRHKKKRDKGKGKKSVIVPENLDNIIDLDDDPPPKDATPYPVGLFQAVTTQPEPTTAPVTFTTPAMKKQSYQVVQTGNPSKLLISAKPHPPPEPPKSKSKRKSKETRDKPTAEKQPFSVTLEDATPKEKDPGFFTFVNVDPLLQPSYVLPTDNIIQESQISTSSAVTPRPNPDKPYSCNLCVETFSREKKLLVHIQAHYNKMDEEDNSRHGNERPTKRTRRS